jgi:hypothetical protein
MFVVGGATRGEVLGKDFKSKRIAASGPSHRVFFLNLVKRGSVMSCLLWEARLAAMFWVRISRLKESRPVAPPTGWFFKSLMWELGSAVGKFKG